MKVVHAPNFFRFLVHKSYSAFAFYPWVFIRSIELKENKQLLRHERIHLRQQLETFVLPFYLIYLTEFLIWLAVEQNGYKAYRRISFEREAYQNDENPEYLIKRKHFAMWRKSIV